MHIYIYEHTHVFLCIYTDIYRKTHTYSMINAQPIQRPTSTPSSQRLQRPPCGPKPRPCQAPALLALAHRPAVRADGVGLRPILGGGGRFIIGLMAAPVLGPSEILFGDIWNPFWRPLDPSALIGDYYSLGAIWGLGGHVKGACYPPQEIMVPGGSRYMTTKDCKLFRLWILQKQLIPIAAAAEHGGQGGPCKAF